MSNNDDHRHTPEEERQIREAALDETIAETFPASDPLSSIPNPDEHDALDAEVSSSVVDEAKPEVRDNRDASRFELATERGVAFLAYVRNPGEMVFVHTEVPESLRGRGIAGRLVEEGLETARREGRRIVAQCPFVRKYMASHPVGG